MSKHTFDQYAITSTVSRVVEGLGFKEPTPIQKQVLPAALRGESLIGQSHTGSGKTHAYLLPLLNQLDGEKDQVQVIITAPTRELAIQIQEEVKKAIQLAGKEEQWRSKLLIGGTDKHKMVDKLSSRAPHIVVGTPGRILDMVKEKAIDLYQAKAFVLDEADLMLDLGFIEDVDLILVRMDENVQMLVFSATIPERLQPFLKKYLTNPTHIQIEDNKPSPESMEHRLIPLRHKEPADVIIEISKAIQPYLAIIFTNGKDHADELADKLMSRGLETGILHGGLSPRERKRMLKDLQNLRYQYIVATDLASRGIDIQGVSHVINAQMPKEEEFYIHRVGRTARAGLQGTAINLYKESDLPLIQKLEKKGLSFEFFEVKKGEWKEVNAYNERQTRERHASDLEKKAKQMVRKPKKVKPGYKKKMKQQADKNKRKLKQERFRKK
ncbi:DEAD/DEAH box helicase [Halobacillus karajensis]|uniref:DEAD-box ATP-dependent RNA helicase CshB n=1 Tax=Halobacillus karajensis TaxID=195088 RepID=A0A024P6T7_9BACI|nr:DEAD/DEAH box helicase [Halobacillus karajensis]CDQ18021.1 DEAD-box ATP-dependent RNA helicase CshB [Halobacillus karajensis]CDQ24371.1 DEAD-box ATP-dependent RNA helicase CshB [Halobacillus karajensis]CDQ29381.1 DEAD-box ATP-dependent RNA helicase CshB [Halobacillus karajensis]